MLASASRQLFQLVGPPVAGAAFFGTLLFVTESFRDLKARYTGRALLAYGGLLAYALYLIFWQNEIRAAWHLLPSVIAFALLFSLVIPGGLFFWIWRVRLRTAETAWPPSSQSDPDRAAQTKIVARILVVWGLVSLLGLLVAVLQSFGPGAATIVFGLLVTAAASIMDLIFRLRMTRLGHRTALLLGGAFNYREYHRVRREHGWPAWPVYLMWALIVAGMAMACLGMAIRYGMHPRR